MSSTVHFFTIPALAPAAAEQELNRFNREILHADDFAAFRAACLKESA